MCSADEVQVVTVEELADDVGPKGEGNPPIVLPPALDVFVWVRPQQVAQQAWRQNIEQISRAVSQLKLTWWGIV